MLHHRSGLHYPTSQRPTDEEEEQLSPLFHRFLCNSIPQSFQFPFFRAPQHPPTSLVSHPLLQFRGMLQLIIFSTQSLLYRVTHNSPPCQSNSLVGDPSRPPKPHHTHVIKHAGYSCVSLQGHCLLLSKAPAPRHTPHQRSFHISQQDPH